MKRRDLDGRSVALLDELEALLANQRAAEIVANDWLHDGSLPVPSLDLIRYFTFRMLTGHGIKIEATKNDRNGLIELLVEHLRNETPEKRAASIIRAFNGLDCFKCENTHGKKDASDPHLHEWLGLLWPYLYPDAPEGDADSVHLQAGTRNRRPPASPGGNFSVQQSVARKADAAKPIERRSGSAPGIFRATLRAIERVKTRISLHGKGFCDSGIWPQKNPATF